MNCWEFNQCGRQQGGSNILELGVCPASEIDGAGEAYWLIAGTFCENRVQGTHAQKHQSCCACEFFQSFGPDHKSRMMDKFANSI